MMSRYLSQSAAEIGFGLLLVLFTTEVLAQHIPRPPPPRPPHIRLREPLTHNDIYLREVLINIEAAQQESNHFREKGKNWASDMLGMSLAFSAFLAGLSVAVQSAKLGSKATRTKNRAALVLAVVGALSSSVGLYFHHESERFLKENRDKYVGLSLEIDQVIADFYISLREQDITDITLRSDPKVKLALIALDKSTDQKLRSIAKTYNQRYGINTNEPLDSILR